MIWPTPIDRIRAADQLSENETTPTVKTSISVRVAEGVETCVTRPSLWDQGRCLALSARLYKEDV